MSFQPIFVPSGPQDVEEWGGFHPVSIGDTFSNGRYRVLHKLGSGGFSTVWLARDHRSQNQSAPLVALKILCAEELSNDGHAELTIPKTLNDFGRATNHLGRHHIQFIQDQFIFHGPSGTHLCIIYPLAGPSIVALYDSPGRIMGSRRLSGDIARKVARQCANTIDFIHSAGIVHGDLSPSNILLKTTARIYEYTDEGLYSILGYPEIDYEAACREGRPQDEVTSIDGATLASFSLLHEDIVIVDFGQSFVVKDPPKDYKGATVFNYYSPELRFESKINKPSDIWGLALTIFQIRAGFPLFESLFGSETEVLRQTVFMLGKPPEPWWSSFEDRDQWFEENGEPKPLDIYFGRTSIREALRCIGANDSLEVSDGPLFEVAGTRLEETEVELLGDLLERMLKYRPEERITIAEVVQHPWFTYIS